MIAFLCHQELPRPCAGTPLAPAHRPPSRNFSFHSGVRILYAAFWELSLRYIRVAAEPGV